MTGPGRDVAEVEALVTDRYLDALLATADRPVPLPDVPVAGGRGRLDAAVRLASDRLAHDLPRFHPSFRFEERLAVRLAQAAAAMRLPTAAGAEGSIAVLPSAPGAWPADLDPLGLPDGDDDDPADRRPLLIGGALTASALSLAGAAWVAWRRGRHPASPMARAARAAHALRGRPA